MAVLKSEAITAECNNCKYYREYGSDVNVFTPGSCRHELPNGIKLKDGRLEFFSICIIDGLVQISRVYF